MNDKILTLPTCGTCVYAQQFKDHTADCHGNPPTVIMLGVGQDVLGRQGARLDTFVPRVRDDRPACHLHKRKIDFAVVGNG